MDVDAYLQKEKTERFSCSKNYVESECIQVCFVQLLIQPVLSQNLSLSSSSVEQVNFVLIQKSAYVDQMLKYHQLLN